MPGDSIGMELPFHFLLVKRIIILDESIFKVLRTIKG